MSKRDNYFKHGDTVYLKSSSVPMTVDALNSKDNNIQLMWMANGEIRGAILDAGLLTVTPISAQEWEV